MRPRRFQILSLDGGGIKGLYSAAVLAAIERDLGCRVTDHFDLITGTSTGGIIALGLGLGLRPHRLVKFYLEYGNKIFPQSQMRDVLHWVRHKYSAEPLTRALKSVFRSKLLGASRKRLVIPAYNLGANDVYLFRTPHSDQFTRDYRVPAWKVALATSAAPTYFPSTKVVDNIRLIDGGTWANNPTLVGIVEAYSKLHIPLERISVLSIGTSAAVIQRPKWLDWGGKLLWGSPAPDVIMEGQSIAVHNQARLLLGKQKVIRINPKVAEDEFALDRAGDAGELIASAAHHSRHFMPTFQESFAGHRARRFVPVYYRHSDAIKR